MEFLESNKELQFVQNLAREIHHQQHGPSAWRGLTEAGREMYYSRAREAIRRAMLEVEED